MAKPKSKEDLILQGLQWASENAEKLKISGVDGLSAEFERVQQAFTSGDLPDEQAAKYGEALIMAVLAAGVASKNLRVIALMTLLETMGAAKWGGPIVANLFKTGFRYGPTTIQKVDEATSWVNESMDRAKDLYAAHIADGEKTNGKADDTKSLVSDKSEKSEKSE